MYVFPRVIEHLSRVQHDFGFVCLSGFLFVNMLFLPFHRNERRRKNLTPAITTISLFREGTLKKKVKILLLSVLEKKDNQRPHLLFKWQLVFTLHLFFISNQRFVSFLGSLFVASVLLKLPRLLLLEERFSCNLRLPSFLATNPTPSRAKTHFCRWF